VVKEIDEWVEAQVLKHDDNKWGSKVSAKLFVGREYVLKHIRGKHAHLIEEQRQRVHACPVFRPICFPSPSAQPLVFSTDQHTLCRVYSSVSCHVV
jgi:Arsenite-resistance protein 2